MKDDKEFWAAVALQELRGGRDVTSAAEVATTLVRLREKSLKGEVPLRFIEQLDLSFRPLRILHEAGIKTIEQLQQLHPNDLEMLEGMGSRSLFQIQEAMHKVGLQFTWEKKPNE